MTVNFVINDDSGSMFISASRWRLNRPAMDEDRLVKKSLKTYIGSLIDEYNGYLAYGKDAEDIQSKAAELQVSESIMMDARTQMFQKKIDFEGTYIPADMGADA